MMCRARTTEYVLTSRDPRNGGPWRNPLTFVLLERDAERAALASRLEDAAGGRGQLRRGARPGGDRQDRAARRGPQLAREAGLPVAFARGSELERSFAFGAVQQLFGRSLGHLEGAAAHAAAALSLDAAEPNHAVLHGLYWLAADLAPLAVVVDDAHWLDRPSLRWLAYMVNRVEELPVALILAERTGEPEELLTRIALHPATTVLAPAPLSRDAVRELAAAALGREPEDDFVRAAADATQGNPFYVHALLAHGGDGAPAAVVDSVRLRLERLPEPCTRLARALAVLDGAASGTVAARLAGLDVRDTVDGRRDSWPPPTSSPATTSSTRSCAAPSTPRSRPPIARTCTPRAARLLTRARARRRPADGRRARRRRVGGGGAAPRRPRRLGARRAGRGRAASCSAPARSRCPPSCGSRCCASSRPR